MHNINDRNAMIIQNLTDAKILVELERRLSFAKASKALGMPAATVSRRIARVEERAGLSLFRRTTRSVTITEAGALAVRHAARILEEADAVEHSIASMRDVASGTVRITTPVIFGQALLAPVVSTFLTENPLCDVQIELSDKPTNIVEDGYDAAIRIGIPVDDMTIARPLGYVSAGLYQRSGAPEVSLASLGGADIGMLHAVNQPETTLSLVSEEGDQHAVRVKPRMVCMNPWLLRDVALTNDLVVVLPAVVAAEELNKGRIIRVLPTWLARSVPVHLATPPHRLLRPSVRAFADSVMAQIPGLLG